MVGKSEKSIAIDCCFLPRRFSFRPLPLTTYPPLSCSSTELPIPMKDKADKKH